jgi:hypothetical protein
MKEGKRHVEDSTLEFVSEISLYRLVLYAKNDKLFSYKGKKNTALFYCCKIRGLTDRSVSRNTLVILHSHFILRISNIQFTTP